MSRILSQTVYQPRGVYKRSMHVSETLGSLGKSLPYLRKEDQRLGVVSPKDDVVDLPKTGIDSGETEGRDEVLRPLDSRQDCTGRPGT